MNARRTLRAGAIAFALLATFAVAPHVDAATQITVTGPDNRAPQTPDAEGRFRFDDLKLRSNAQNTFTVTATDDAGRNIEKQRQHHAALAAEHGGGAACARRRCRPSA